jgi:hypothetical protein
MLAVSLPHCDCVCALCHAILDQPEQLQHLPLQSAAYQACRLFGQQCVTLTGPLASKLTYQCSD